MQEEKGTTEDETDGWYHWLSNKMKELSVRVTLLADVVEGKKPDAKECLVWDSS